MTIQAQDGRYRKHFYDPAKLRAKTVKPINLDYKGLYRVDGIERRVGLTDAELQRRAQALRDALERDGHDKGPATPPTPLRPSETRSHHLDQDRETVRRRA